VFLFDLSYKVRCGIFHLWHQKVSDFKAFRILNFQIRDAQPWILARIEGRSVVLQSEKIQVQVLPPQSTFHWSSVNCPCLSLHNGSPYLVGYHTRSRAQGRSVCHSAWCMSGLWKVKFIHHLASLKYLIDKISYKADSLRCRITWKAHPIIRKITSERHRTYIE
jgi:hypothetical protein